MVSEQQQYEAYKFGICIIFLMVLSQVFSIEFVAARIAKSSTIIKSENGDIIDCVDIYQQPAFSHPLLKNHALQIKPSSIPSGIKSRDFSVRLSQIWLNKVQCPEGTIPITRTEVYKPKKAIPFLPNRTQTTLRGPFDPPVHEYAQVSVVNGNFFGAHATINVWKPATFNGEYSFSQLWVLSGRGTELNSMEAGWLVRAEENQTVFFIFWTSDGYQTTGCYNLECPGFVQTNDKFPLGAPIEPLSVYGGDQYDVDITIYKDRQSGNWWLKLQDQVLGYWPGSIFTGLAERSNLINWGGEIINSDLGGQHTSTQMGSGHFPGEGFGKASFFRYLGYLDESGSTRQPEQLVPYISNPSCYDLQVVAEKGENAVGVGFYYGGPGHSDICP